MAKSIPISGSEAVGDRTVEERIAPCTTSASDTARCATEIVPRLVPMRRMRAAEPQVQIGDDLAHVGRMLIAARKSSVIPLEADRMAHR